MLSKKDRLVCVPESKHQRKKKLLKNNNTLWLFETLIPFFSILSPSMLTFFLQECFFYRIKFSCVLFFHHCIECVWWCCIALAFPYPWHRCANAELSYVVGYCIQKESNRIQKKKWKNTHKRTHCAMTTL